MPSQHPLPWSVEPLRQQLSAFFPGLGVEVVASIGSTNTELLERARRAAVDHPERRPLSCLLVAEHQTQGRGRQGKPWQSGAHRSLTFSLALPLAPADWSGLSLAVGLALAEALDPPRQDRPPRLGIKWPNDLLLRDSPSPGDRLTGDEPGSPPSAGSARQTLPSPIGRKLGGILIETVQIGRCRMAVVGVGLNLLPQTLDPAAAALSWGQASLQELQPDLSAPAALACVALPLLRALLDFERAGFAPLRARFSARDLLAGRAVTTTLPGLAGGVADGVDEHGTLWLQLPSHPGGPAGQRLPVSSGEVSLRPGTSPDLNARPPATPPATPEPETGAC
jgi:BirA family biotin operon repressor/biotin-[acetyl-CoA-carboxylase] ligase